MIIIIGRNQIEKEALGGRAKISRCGGWPAFVFSRWHRWCSLERSRAHYSFLLDGRMVSPLGTLHNRNCTYFTVLTSKNCLKIPSKSLFNFP